MPECESFYCLYCDGIGSCSCDSEDVEMSYFLFEELPKALKEFKELEGSYPIRAWNKQKDWIFRQ